VGAAPDGDADETSAAGGGTLSSMGVRMHEERSNPASKGVETITWIDSFIGLSVCPELRRDAIPAESEVIHAVVSAGSDYPVINPQSITRITIR